MDFKLNVNHDGDIRILQITDMQIIDANQRRFPDRIKGWSVEAWVPENNEKNLYSHIRYLKEKTNPDLIIITGDIIYGEFDDAGTSFVEFCNFMDSLEIPWAPVYGNHDNESYKGIDWQCETFANAKYSLFKRGEVFGNSNYSIGIYQNGTLQRIMYMVDSNGCGKLAISQGLREDQIQWVKDTAAKYPDVPSFLCYHIPSGDFIDAYIAQGYLEKPDPAHTDFVKFEIGVDVEAKNGDFGKKREWVTAPALRLMPMFKECRTDGVFAGHYHINNTSVLHEGIRFTFGLKTGLYDYYDKTAIGGTAITLNGKDFKVEHVYYPLED